MKIIIFGTNEVSCLAKFYLENDSDYKPYGFCIDSSYIKESSVEGLPVFPFEEIDKFSKNEFSFFAPLYDNKIREEKSKIILSKGYNLISYVSSKATVFTKKIGYNCFIMENNVIQPYVEIGNNNIFWSGNHIGHHSTIKNNVFFSSHVVLSGKCVVEDYCWLGVNSCVRDSITIAEGSFIGMGSVITKKTKPYKKYIGNPAKEYGDVIS
jgi:sugar O-acyltransferase (sialic acid O-acetyltransferase NeuD family)